MTTPDVIQGASVLVTGSNRGLGKALVDEALRRGASRVFAGSRHPAAPHADRRVTQLRLDVTDAQQIEAAVQAVPTLDVLVNNAGVGAFEVSPDEASLERHLAVNLFGTLRVTRAFTSRLSASRGQVVNVSSIVAMAALPVMPSYSISKAAALSLTQTQRATLRGLGIGVYAVLAGPIDTDMSRDIPLAKASPADVARAIFDGVNDGQEEIFPDALSAGLSAGWNAGIVKALEQENAKYLDGSAA
jgi:NAD(P)-dependent dehydrogenase (short-subunit alcohol dehydrogenase family)